MAGRPSEDSDAPASLRSPTPQDRSTVSAAAGCECHRATRQGAQPAHALCRSAYSGRRKTARLAKWRQGNDFRANCPRTVTALHCGRRGRIYLRSSADCSLGCRRNEDLMVRFLFGSIVAALPSVLTSQVVSPVIVETCQPTEVEATVATSTPRIRAGTRPQFSVSVTNTSSSSIRVLDVRDGRRNDLQDVYFELVIVKDGRVVDLPTVISDPGPISSADYLVLNPGEHLDVRQLSYKRVAERLAPGEYAAVVLLWRNPEEAPTSRCRSSDVRFVVTD